MNDPSPTRHTGVWRQKMFAKWFRVMAVNLFGAVVYVACPHY